MGSDAVEKSFPCSLMFSWTNFVSSLSIFINNNNNSANFRLFVSADVREKRKENTRVSIIFFSFSLFCRCYTNIPGATTSGILRYIYICISGIKVYLVNPNPSTGLFISNGVLPLIVCIRITRANGPVSSRSVSTDWWWKLTGINLGSRRDESRYNFDYFGRPLKEFLSISFNRIG